MRSRLDFVSTAKNHEEFRTERRKARLNQSCTGCLCALKPHYGFQPHPSQLTHMCPYSGCMRNPEFPREDGVYDWEPDTNETPAVMLKLYPRAGGLVSTGLYTESSGWKALDRKAKLHAKASFVAEQMIGRKRIRADAE